MTGEFKGERLIKRKLGSVVVNASEWKRLDDPLPDDPGYYRTYGTEISDRHISIIVVLSLSDYKKNSPDQFAQLLTNLHRNGMEAITFLVHEIDPDAKVKEGYIPMPGNVAQLIKEDLSHE